MADELVKISDDFWNVRGSFKIAGLVDVGTQMSVARLRSGGFVLLDSYELTGPIRDEVLRLTDGGSTIAAILNLHPFHTLHVQSVANTFPQARLYGTRRHVAREPQLRWETCHTEDPELTELFEDFRFSVPQGVDFIPAGSHLHFGSVLAIHLASKTLHVDDTLTWMSLPLFQGLRFHPTLAKVLKRRAGAAAEFRTWAHQLSEQCVDVQNLCTAHMRALPPKGVPVATQVRGALSRVERTLAAHTRRYG